MKAGKRTLKRRAMNRRIDADLKARGIETCEIRIPGVCVRSILLSHAHSKKSRNIITDADWLEAALCCIPCHEKIELLKENEMGEIVRAAIARRPALTIVPQSDNEGVAT